MLAKAICTPLKYKKSEASAADVASQAPSNIEGTFVLGRKVTQDGIMVTQDRIIMIELKGTILLVVADGHAPSGEEHAELVCQEAKKFLESINFHTTTPSKVKRMIRELFHKIHDQSRGLPSGGTTCTIVIMSFCPKTHRRYILTAHVGDSDAVVVYGDDVTKLTAGDHKVTNVLEKDRIEKDYQRRCAAATAQGLDLRSVSRVSMVYKDLSPVYTIDENGNMVLNTLVERWGRPLPKCNVSGEVSGYMRHGNQLLNMTRALGDISFEDTGISQDPTVSIMFLSPDQNAIVVIATDGMWNGIHPTHEQKMASSFPQFRCLKELLGMSDSIGTFGANVFEQIRSFFGEYYDDIAIGIQNVPTHEVCRALHLAAVPEYRAMPSGVPCDVLHYYDCYNPEDYDCDIEEQFPAPVEEIAMPVVDVAAPVEEIAAPVEEIATPVEEIVEPVITVADVIGHVFEAAKRERSNRYGKAPRIRTLLPRECKKYGALYRVNQPLNRVNQPRNRVNQPRK